MNTILIVDDEYLIADILAFALERKENWWLLIWLFWRHRDRYRDIRTWMVLFTALALVVQLVPVAPPRLMPQLGFVDVARLYGQSV